MSSGEQWVGWMGDGEEVLFVGCRGAVPIVANPSCRMEQEMTPMSRQAGARTQLWRNNLSLLVSAIERRSTYPGGNA